MDVIKCPYLNKHAQSMLIDVCYEYIQVSVMTLDIAIVTCCDYNCIFGLIKCCRPYENFT